MSVPASTGAARLDLPAVRAAFPILAETAHGRRLAYLDNAATTQKPQVVIDAITTYYASMNANVHRGVHMLSERATAAYEGARTQAARFLGAADPREIVFTRNATEGINLVAASWGSTHLARGDEVIVSALEHHSNLVPWQLACERSGARLREIPIDDRGVLDIDAYTEMLSSRTRLVAVTHLSNALGTITPVEKIVALAHAAGAVVLVDGAQAAYHRPVNVRAIDADFYVVTGHKLYGPTGIGILYGKTERLESMPPYQGGGDMISSVTFERSTWNTLPYKFEAGTPHIEGAVGLAAAMRFVSQVGFDAIMTHEASLLAYASEAIRSVPGVRLVGTAPDKASIVSFVMDGVHPHDIGTIVDRHGVAIRTGHHCAQPLMARLGVDATARASLAMYNSVEDVYQLVAALHEVRRFFS